MNKLKKLFFLRTIKKTFKVKLNDFQKSSLDSCLDLQSCDKRYNYRRSGATTSAELEALYLSYFQNKRVLFVLYDLNNVRRVFTDILNFIKKANIHYINKGCNRIDFTRGGMILFTTKEKAIEDTFGYNHIFKVICDNVDFKYGEEIFDRFNNVRLYKTFE